jgi:hypothetical protein
MYIEGKIVFIMMQLDFKPISGEIKVRGDFYNGVRIFDCLMRFKGFL